MAGMPSAHFLLLMVFVMLIVHNAVHLCTTMMMHMSSGNGCFGLGRKHAHQGDCYNG